MEAKGRSRAIVSLSAAALALTAGALVRPLLPYVLLAIPACILAARLERDWLSRCAMALLVLPGVACALALPLMSLGVFARAPWLCAWAAMCVVFLLFPMAKPAAGDSKSKEADGSADVGADDNAASGAGLPMRMQILRGLPSCAVVLIVCLPVLLGGLLRPYRPIVSGHFWSIHDGGRYLARTGRYPWLGPMDVGHFNDHLFYNPGATLTSAACYLWTPDVWQGEASANLLPVFTTVGALCAMMAAARVLWGAGLLGAAGFVVLFASMPVFYVCGHLTHDVMAPLVVGSQLFFVLRWLKTPSASNLPGVLISLAMGGMSRVYLGPVLILAVLALRLLARSDYTARGFRALAAPRRRLACLAVALAVMCAWNVVLLARFGNPVYPHGTQLFGHPAGLSADEREAVEFCAGANPGYVGTRSRLEKLKGLFGFRPGMELSGKELIAVLVQGDLFSVFWACLAAVGLYCMIRAEQLRGAALLLVAYVVVCMCWLLWPWQRDVSSKHFLPAAVPVALAAAYGTAVVIAALLKVVGDRKGNAAPNGLKAIGSHAALTALLLAFVLSPGPVRLSHWLAAASRGDLKPGRKSVALHPELHVLYWMLVNHRQMADSLLVASYSEPAGGVLFLLRDRPYWEYHFYESPRLYRLHAASNDAEVMAELMRLGIEHVLLFFDNPRLLNEYRNRLHARGASEHFLTMLVTDKERFRPVGIMEGFGTANTYFLLAKVNYDDI